MTLTIPADDFGKIRIFSLSDAPSPALRDRAPEALQAAFGTDAFNTDFVDVVDVAALDELGLTGLLRQGYDFTPDAADEAALRNVTGWAILVMSRATAGREVTLTLGSGVAHVTTIGSGATLSSAEPLRADTATGVLDGTPEKKPVSDAAMSGRVALIALLVLFLLVAVMIWIA